jgi:DNA-directed RNA polymerase subunit D
MIRLEDPEEGVEEESKVYMMTIDIEILEKDEGRIKVILKNTSLPLVNAVRRATIEEVPTMAIDYVIFYDNTSVLHDEIITHRLGMLPLTSDDALDKYLPPEECSVEGAEFKEGCYASLLLEVETREGEVRTVYSGELASRDDPNVRPVSNNVPIVILGPNQRVVLEARARLGRGREHIKWSPATVSVSKYLSKIEIDDKKCVMCGACAEYCPTGALRIESDKLIADELKCTLCRQCVRVCDYDAIKLDWYKDRYQLYIESSGALRPERILVEAVKAVINKLDSLLNEVNRLGEVVTE